MILAGLSRQTFCILQRLSTETLRRNAAARSPCSHSVNSNHMLAGREKRNESLKTQGYHRDPARHPQDIPRWESLNKQAWQRAGMNKVLKYCYGNKRNGLSGVGSPILPVPHLAGLSSSSQKKSVIPKVSRQWNSHPGLVPPPHFKNSPADL